MPTFATPGPIAATVQVAGAQVRVTASDRTDTVVLVEPIDKASKKDVRVANKTKVDFAGGRLSVKTTVSGNKNGSVTITIDLPTGSGLAAYLAHSAVHTECSACPSFSSSVRFPLGYSITRAYWYSVSASWITWPPSSVLALSVPTGSAISAAITAGATA